MRHLTLIHELVEHKSIEVPGEPALSFGSETLTYGQLWFAVRKAATFLSRLGIAPHDRVAVFLDKRFETVAALLGASVAGGVFVPVNPVLKGGQAAHVVRDSGARILVTSVMRLASVRPHLVGLGLRHVVLIDAHDPSSLELPNGIMAYTWNLKSEMDPFPRRETVAISDTERRGVSACGRTDTDIAAILYTSGSTGPPKGVVVSHRNLLVGATSVSSYLGSMSDDVVLAVLPLSFDAGLSQLTTAFAVGAHVRLLNYLLPRDVVRACEEYGVTGITCVPSLWSQLASVGWPESARSKLRYFANTGGHMPRILLGELRQIFPTAAPFLMYGLTEAFRSTYLDPSQVDIRPDSIGKAIPGAEVLVLRPDGTQCAPGEEGELVHRGSLVSLGYWNDPEGTAARFRPIPGYDEPWRAVPEPAVWSGDTVVRDDEGYLYYVGRTDDMIKTSGYRVSPTEVEETACGTGLVREAVAIGIPDGVLGHRIALVVSGADDDLDLTRLIEEMRRQLPAYMVPKEVHVRSGLPRSPNGKLDRAAIRAAVVS
jgi:acyl-CoA ligase (AMP-forming) (exosortase A-associated)